jgi:hypothetical protein
MDDVRRRTAAQPTAAYQISVDTGISKPYHGSGAAKIADSTEWDM